MRNTRSERISELIERDNVIKLQSLDVITAQVYNKSNVKQL